MPVALTVGRTRRGTNVAGVGDVRARVDTGRPSRCHFAKPPSSTAALSWPSQRSIHHSRDAYIRSPWS